MADTIAVMNEGRIEQLGPGEDLYERPRTRVRRQLPRALEPHRRQRRRAATGRSAEFATDEGAALRVPVARASTASTAPVRVGVRPEKITIAAAGGGPPAGANACAGTSSVASYLGVSISYQVATPAGRELTVIAPNRHAGAATLVRSRARRSC